MQTTPSKITALFRTAMCALLLLGAASPVLAAATATPLVVIRFNQPRVVFDQQLFTAISKALEVKPDVMLEVVSYAPAVENPATNQQWQQVAGHNTRAVIAALNAMGVPMERITVAGKAAPGLDFDETHVFVR